MSECPMLVLRAVVGVAVCALPRLTADTYEWTAGGDGVSIYQEANWTLDGNGTTAIPQIDPNVAIGHDLVVTGGIPGGGGGGSAHLRLGNSGSLAVEAGVFRMAMGAAAGIHADGTIGGARSSVRISGTGELLAQFLGDQSVVMDGASTLTLYGGGDPLNNSVVALAGSWSGEIRFLAESVADVQAEHFPKITLDGGPLQLGGNVELIDDGGGGAVLRARSDGDGDGMPDAWEIEYFGDTSRDGTEDFDEDGLGDREEFERGANPTVADTDDDGLEDGPEVLAGTDPVARDTDRDGLDDGVETGTGWYVSPQDTGTDPLDPNSDGDRIRDGGEVRHGSDPNDPAEAPDLPNVILILADDLGVGEIGAYGQTRILTPALDTLAAEGMRFDAFYSPSAVCAPTRAQLLTGKHSGQAFIRNNGEVGNGYQRALHAGAFTLGHLMREAGYATSCVGKWGLGGPGTTGEPLDQGFDHFFGYLGQVQAHHYYPSRLVRDRGEVYYSPTLAAQKGTAVEVAGAVNETGFDDLALSLANKNNNGNVHSHDAMTREAMEWIEARRSEAFFLYLAYPVPHVSVQAPGHIDDLTDADGIVFDNASRTCVDEFYPVDPVSGLRPFGAPISHPGSGHYTATADKRHEYAAMISAMDRDIGRIRDLLETLDLHEQTLILFTSDNGVTFLGEVDREYFNSAAGLRGTKGNLYEGGIRAPFLAWWPGKIEAGSSSAILGNLDDLMPTLGELTGASHPADVTGRSILPTLLGRGEDQRARETLYFEFSNSGSWTRALRRGDWKLHRSLNKSTGVADYELYDLAADPDESDDLAAAQPALVGELARLMDASHAPSEFFFRPTDELPIASGAALSYGTLGLRLGGDGSLLGPLERDVDGPCSFAVTVDPAAGARASFLFGEGENPASMVAVSVDRGAALYRIDFGSDSATAPIPVEVDPSGGFDLEVGWDPAGATVSLTHGATGFSLGIGAPPAVVDHIGYRMQGGAGEFAPALLSLPTPEIGDAFWQVLPGGLRLGYTRPGADGENYDAEQSVDLESWVPARPRREQAIREFGNVLRMELDFPGPDAGSRLFYRVRHGP